MTEKFREMDILKVGKWSDSQEDKGQEEVGRRKSG